MRDPWDVHGLESRLQAAGEDVADHARPLKRELQRRRSMRVPFPSHGVGVPPQVAEMAGRCLSDRARCYFVSPPPIRRTNSMPRNVVISATQTASLGRGKKRPDIRTFGKIIPCSSRVYRVYYTNTPPPDITRRDTTNKYCSAKRMKDSAKPVPLVTSATIIAVGYSLLNLKWLVFVDRLGCGCHSGFNTNVLTLIVALAVGSVGMLGCIRASREVPSVLKVPFLFLSLVILCVFWVVFVSINSWA